MIHDDRLREIAEAATKTGIVVPPHVGYEERAEMAAVILRLRAAIREKCRAYCEPFRPYNRHAPECLACELEN